MNLDFNFNQTSSGVLNPKDLSFFYYGVGLEKMTNAPILYNWDEGIQAFVDNKQMTIEGLDENEVNTLDENFEKAVDKTCFLCYNNNKYERKERTYENPADTGMEGAGIRTAQPVFRTDCVFFPDARRPDLTDSGRYV